MKRLQQEIEKACHDAYKTIETSPKDKDYLLGKVVAYAEVLSLMKGE